MGGGSADAAALIKAISRLEGLNLSMDQMQKIGAKVGADVPYCLYPVMPGSRDLVKKLNRSLRTGRFQFF